MSVVFKETKDSIDLLKDTGYARQITKIQRKNGVTHDVVLSSGGMNFLVFNCLNSNRESKAFIVCYTDERVMGPACRNLQVAFSRARNIISLKNKDKKQGR